MVLPEVVLELGSECYNRGGVWFFLRYTFQHLAASLSEFVWSAVLLWLLDFYSRIAVCFCVCVFVCVCVCVHAKFFTLFTFFCPLHTHTHTHTHTHIHTHTHLLVQL